MDPGRNRRSAPLRGCRLGAGRREGQAVLSTNRRSAWIALGVFTLLAAWLLWDGFGPGRVLVAHESLSRSAPWSVPLDKAEAYNGYLVEQFINVASNQRTDAWGGDVAGRLRFPLAVAQRVIAAIGADRTGIRLSPYGVFNGSVADDATSRPTPRWRARSAR